MTSVGFSKVKVAKNAVSMIIIGVIGVIVLIYILNYNVESDHHNASKKGKLESFQHLKNVKYSQNLNNSTQVNLKLDRELENTEESSQAIQAPTFVPTIIPTFVPIDYKDEKNNETESQSKIFDPSILNQFNPENLANPTIHEDNLSSVSTLLPTTSPTSSLPYDESVEIVIKSRFNDLNLPFKSIYNEFRDSVDYLISTATEKCEFLNEDSSSQNVEINVVEDILNIFKGKEIKSTSSPPENFDLDSIQIMNIAELAKDVLTFTSPKVVFEYSNLSPEKTVSFQIAKSFCDVSFLLNNYSPRDLQIIHKEYPMENFIPFNLFAINDKDSEIDISSSNFDCFQIISNLELLTRDLLPFEFETLVGEMLCKCNQTIFPRELPTSLYFANWESSNSLLSSALTSMKGQCNIDWGNTPSYLASKYEKKYGSSWINSFYLIVRNESSSVSAFGYFNLNQLKSLSLDRHSRFSLSFQEMKYFELLNNSNLLNNEDIYWVGNRLLSANDLIKESDRKLLNYPTYKFKDFNAILKSQDSSQSLKSHIPVVTLPPTATTPTRETISTETVKTINSSLPLTESELMIPTNESSIPTTSRRRLYATTAFSSATSLYSSSRSKLSQPLDKLGDNIESDIFWSVSEDNSSSDLDHQLMKNSLESYYSEKAETSKSNLKSPSDTRKFRLTKSSKETHQILFRTESLYYQQWMNLITRSSKPVLAKLRSSKLIYIFGDKISLFSLKLTKLLNSLHKQVSEQGYSIPPTVISVLMEKDQLSSHYQLSKLMQLPNNLIGFSSWSPLLIHNFLQLPEIADVLIIDMHVFWKILSHFIDSSEHCEINKAFEYFSLVLSMSSNIYLKIPKIQTIFQSLQTIFSIECFDSFLNSFNTYEPSSEALRISPEIKFLSYILQFQSFEGSFQFENLNACNDQSNITYCFIHLQNQYLESNEVTQQGNLSPLELTQIHFSSRLKSNHFSLGSISLFTLKSIGLLSNYYKPLLSLIINIPLWEIKKTLNDESKDDLLNLNSKNLFLQINPFKEQYSLVYVSLTSQDTYPKIEISFSPKTKGLKKPTASSLSSELNIHHKLFEVLQEELESHHIELNEGKFSFVEYHSQIGYVSTRLSRSFPEATFVSIESNIENTKIHRYFHRHSFNQSVLNNAICYHENSESNLEFDTIYQNIAECPELFRYQLFFNDVWNEFVATEDLSSWGNKLSHIFSSALTSFVYAPNVALLSWAMSNLYGYSSFRSISKEVCILKYLSNISYSSFPHGFKLHWLRDNENIYLQQLDKSSSLRNHPRSSFSSFYFDWLFRNAKTSEMDSSLSVLFSPIRYNSKEGDHPVFSFPLLRTDIVNMTRHVHHHYDYRKDGHTRTYTMRIQLNETIKQELIHAATSIASESDFSTWTLFTDSSGSHLKIPSSTLEASKELIFDLPLGMHPNNNQIVDVKLYRDRDDFPIPYTTIYGITLISLLRLGLIPDQRDEFFTSFLDLNLYEDMAPWNIVMMGQKLDYIDYDTRDVTFDHVLPKVYQIMTVLMNYKRTVEDFKKCSIKAPTVYGLPYASDCVGQSNDWYKEHGLTCPELKLPVPCGDGQCHTDYVSCLRSLAHQAQTLSIKDQPSVSLIKSKPNPFLDSFTTDLASAMKSMVAKFNQSSASKISFEEFLAASHSN